MKGKWDRFYKDVTEPRAYGDSLTYVLGAEWLSGLSIEDWGCGLGWFKQFHKGEYVGVDGSASKFAAVCADLRSRRSKTEGLFMRHILEHNHDWHRVLKNAVASFQKRMVLVMFTPFSHETHCIQESVLGIPDLSFRKEDLLAIIGPYIKREETHQTKTQYGIEHVFYLEKP